MMTNRVPYLNRSEWSEEELRNKDKSVMHPLQINQTLAFILIIICIFGLPLNLEMIVQILYNKTMRLKSR